MASSAQSLLPRLSISLSTSSSHSSPSTRTAGVSMSVASASSANLGLSLFPSHSIGHSFDPISPNSLRARRREGFIKFERFLSASSSTSALAKTAFIVSASSSSNASSSNKGDKNTGKSEVQVEEDEVDEVEEDLPWIQEKALDLVEFTGSVTQAIPGPRVGKSPLPWILAVPLAYVGITFVIAVVKTIRKFNSPREIRKKMVNKNIFLCKSIDELFEKGKDALQPSDLVELVQKTDFGMEDIFRKYIRYALNEKPFNPDSVANLIQLRKASMLDDSQVAEVLNDISRRIVKDKGPVVMDVSGYSEKGFKRKLAVQALFGKVYYLSELPEFCTKDSSSLVVKEIFGVTDEDAEKLRMHTVSEVGDLDSLEKMVDSSDSSEKP